MTSRAAHDVDVLVACGLDGPAHRLLDAGDERERAAFRLLVGTMRDDEERQAPRVLAAPVPGGLVRPAPADDRADAKHHLFEPRGVLRRPARPSALPSYVHGPPNTQ